MVVSEGKTSETEASEGSDAESSEATQRGDWPEGGSHARYLVGVNYEERTERRRAEYRLDNWGGSVEKLPGMARIVEGEGFYDLLDELQEAVDDVEHLYVYELQDIAPSAAESVGRIDRVYEIDPDRVEWAVESLLNKRRATESDGEYRIDTGDGDASVTVETEVTELSDGTRLEITLRGPAPAPAAMKDAMVRDLGYLLPEPVEVFDT